MADSHLEDLIRRFESGDRDPKLLRTLNEAAWESFHDPWEVSLKERLEAFKAAVQQEYGSNLPEPPPDPEALLPFTEETLRRYLEGAGFSYWTSNWGSFMTFWRYDVNSDRVVRAMFMVEGKQKNIFRLRMVADRRVAREEFDQARRLCNAWNEAYRWPRAYLEKPDLSKEELRDLHGEEPASAVLAMDFQLYLPAGIPQVVFDRQVKDVLVTAWNFWEMAKQEYGL